MGLLFMILGPVLLRIGLPVRTGYGLPVRLLATVYR